MARGLICLRAPDDELTPEEIAAAAARDTSSTTAAAPDIDANGATAVAATAATNPNGIPDAPAIFNNQDEYFQNRRICGTGMLAIQRMMYANPQYNGGFHWNAPACIPLAAVDVRATIHDFCAQVTVTHTRAPTHATHGRG